MSRCKLGTKVVDMNRRGFLGMIIGGLATAAAVRTFPFRVFSFPTEIIAPSRLSVDQITNLSLEAIADQIPDLIERDAELYKMFLGQRYGEYYDPTGPYMGLTRTTGPYPSSQRALNPVPSAL